MRLPIGLNPSRGASPTETVRAAITTNRTAAEANGGDGARNGHRRTSDPEQGPFSAVVPVVGIDFLASCKSSRPMGGEQSPRRRAAGCFCLAWLRPLCGRHRPAVSAPLFRFKLLAVGDGQTAAHGRWSAATAFDEALLWLFPGEAAPGQDLVPPRSVCETTRLASGEERHVPLPATTPRAARGTGLRRRAMGVGLTLSTSAEKKYGCRTSTPAPGRNRSISARTVGVGLTVSTPTDLDISLSTSPPPDPQRRDGSFHLREDDGRWVNGQWRSRHQLKKLRSQSLSPWGVG